MEASVCIVDVANRFECRYFSGNCDLRWLLHLALLPHNLLFSVLLSSLPCNLLFLGCNHPLPFDLLDLLLDLPLFLPEPAFPLDCLLSASPSSLLLSDRLLLHRECLSEPRLFSLLGVSHSLALSRDLQLSQLAQTLNLALFLEVLLVLRSLLFLGKCLLLFLEGLLNEGSRCLLFLGAN